MGHGDTTEVDAGTAVLAALTSIADRLRELEPAALADEPDAVHQLRTHVRRVRSLLAAFAPVFDGAAAVALRRRYGELGDELGTVRDIEVRMQVAEEALDEASDHGDLDDGRREAARARLIDDERETHRLAHARFAERQGLPRAAARRAALEAFLADPPLARLSGEPAHDVLADLISEEARRTLRRVDRLGGDDDPLALHEVRKAGRRLRYAAEAVSTEPAEIFDGRVRDLAQVGHELHDVLGDHRDEVLFAEHVRRTAAHVAHEGGAAIMYEQLAEAADRRAALRLRELPSVLKRLRRLVED